jgi:hypothetical protein
MYSTSPRLRTTGASWLSVSAENSVLPVEILRSSPDKLVGAEGKSHADPDIVDSFTKRIFEIKLYEDMWNRNDSRACMKLMQMMEEKS